MKTLSDYMTHSSKRAEYSHYHESVCDFFGRELDPEAMNADTDYILETLNSHDPHKLQDKLYKEFNDEYHVTFKDYTDKSFHVVTDKYRELAHNKKFKSLLEYYGYYLSEVEWKIRALFIEATYSTKIDIHEYHDKCYHFTYSDNAESILRNGLRIKNETYRDYPERIYLYRTNERLFDGDELNDDVKSFCQKILGTDTGIAILRIDLSHVHNIPIYRDTAMKEDEAIFTYHNIPAKFIKLIKKF